MNNCTKSKGVETKLIALTSVTIGGQLQIPLLLATNYVDIDRNQCPTPTHAGVNYININIVISYIESHQKVSSFMKLL